MSYQIVMTLTIAVALAPLGTFADSTNTFVMPEKLIETQQQEAHCNSLQENIDRYKNRPLRRSAALDRYKLECTGAERRPSNKN